MNAASQSFARLYEIVQRLRAPDGCPWDLEQSPATMRGDLIEETYECVEAINENDPAHIREELGDVFLLATMISYMHEQSGDFSVADALEEICEKLIRRHPHVFGESEAATAAEVLKQWDIIKVEQEGRKPKDSVLDQVSRALPPLERAFKLQKKAAKVGFDWPEAAGVWKKVAEELAEAKEAHEQHTDEENPQAAAHLEEELGDLLFSVVNICRYLRVDPAVALHGANIKFTGRFKHVEKRMKETGESMEN
ncbi:MAG: nucleoside triphosphate pyrophosphohydrolase, partial [Treponemataceae bacterium]